MRRERARRLAWRLGSAQFPLRPRRGEMSVERRRRRGAWLEAAVLVVLVAVRACEGHDDSLWASLLAPPSSPTPVLALDEEGLMLGDDVEADANRDDDDHVWDALLAVTEPAVGGREPDTPRSGVSSAVLPDSLTAVELPPSDGDDVRAGGSTSSGNVTQSPPADAVRETIDSDAVSLAFVFDSTGSMWRDLAQLKSGAAAVLSAMVARTDKPILDYVFVPFNDPGVGPATVTTNPSTFKAQLDAVKVDGGGDCPEPALTALLQALNLVRPNSYVYVFTDASAKDYYLLPDVLSLVQRKQTQVVFVMTGNCKDGNTPRYQSMENIAAASSGQVYNINKSEVENVLDFVKRTLDSQKVNLVSVDFPEASRKEHAVQVDETIREFTVSVSGENPHISVVDPDGVRIDRPPALQNILDLDNVKVVAVKEPVRGSWTVETSSDSKHAVRLTGLSVVDFSYGFSAQLTDRLDETYHRPLQDASNFILVGGSDMGSVWNLTSVDLLSVDGSTLQTIPLSPLNSLDGLYRGGPFLPPGQDELFYLANVGYGRDGYPIKRITPTAISAQAGGLPMVELHAKKLVWLNGSLNLRCQIDSLLPFTGWFFKSGVPISKKQKYQQTALMTLKIDHVTENMSGEYICRASNVKGFSKDVAFVIVTGPPPEIITKPEVQISPQHQVVLDCFIRSQLKFNSTWIKIHSDFPRGNELVENNPRYSILPNASLVIDPALPQDTGLFSCVAESQGGRKESRVQLLVHDPLHISVHPKSFEFQRGDSFSITCEANSALPEFYWERDGHIIQKKTSGHVTIETVGQQLTLHVKNAKLTDEAVYRCVGTNNKESVEAEAEAHYVEIPSVKIENIEDMVRAGDQVLLKCVASGHPKPEARWLWQGRNVTSISNFKAFEDGTLHIDNVRLENAGQLDCVAHNSVGEVKDSINLTVGYPPVVMLKPEVLQLPIEGSGFLLCNGTGIPNPRIHWERQDGSDIDLMRIHQDQTSGTLFFSGANISDEGLYICFLENKYGQVILEGKVVITGVVAPGLGVLESKYQDLISKTAIDIELTCNVSIGNPVPHITWFKDNYLLDPTNFDDISFHANGSLSIHNTDLKHTGNYKCEATNVGGTISRVVQLTVMDPPVLESSDVLNLTEKVGNNALLSCRAYGTPLPDIQWLQSENSPIALTERILQTYEGLVIIGLQLEDTGKYTCVAVNQAGSANRTIALTVQDPPHILGEIVMELIANVGDIIHLPCNASGEPSPEFIWSHNYEYLSYNDHILASTNGDGLIITSISETDGGEYLCSAFNDAGSANKTITVTVQELPYIDTSDPSQVVVTAGLSATLACRAKGIPPPRIVWTFKGQPLVSANETQSVSDEHSLILSDVRESDSGSYICTAYNLAGSDARAVKLVVQVVPTIEPWQDNVKVLEGQNLVLDCHMHGVPLPKGSLFKDGVAISETKITESSVQYIVAARLSDAGKYTCEAVNEIGTTEKVMEVTVVAPPRTLAPFNISLNTISGNDVSLDCITSTLYGHPSPTINWTFDGIPINASNIYISSDAGTLYIKKIMLLQSGVYKCIALNEAGNSSRNFNVSVQEPPLIQEEFLVKKTLMEGEDLSIQCSASGIPKPTISWIFNNKSLSQREDHVDLLLMNDNTLVIISAQANTSGIYTCVAQNEVGEDKQQMYVEVYVPVTLTRDDVIREEVNEGYDTVLSCPASDALEVEWRQNGVPIDFTANERSDEAHFKLLDGGKTLAIFESRPTDNGTYTCTASNPVGSKTATFHLDVLWAPFFEEFGIGQKEFTIIEGNSVTFDCLSNGSPTPKVIWKVNDSQPVTERTAPGVVVLPNSRFMLKIPIVRAHHAGAYKCQAINRIGFINRKFILHVIVPPYMETDKEDHYEVLRGTTVSFVCPIMGFPKPVYVWDHSNSSLLLDWDKSRVELLNDSQIMVIPNIDFSDGGLYVCNGSNQAGFKQKHFNVSVTGLQKSSSMSAAPSITNATEIEDVNAVAGSSLSLECTAHGQPLPDIQWTHNGHMLLPDNTGERFDLDTSSVTQTLSIDFSGSASSGKYVCHATNNQGTAEKIFRVRFQVVPKIDGETKTVVEKVTSVHGLPFSMHCISVGEPTPVISWLRDGSFVKPDGDVKIEGAHDETLHFMHSYDYHSGNYTCTATNNAGTVSKTFLLDVLVPPFHPNNTEEVNKNVLRHELLSLDCDFRGHPEPELMWIKGIEPISTLRTPEGPHFTDNNRTLVISSTELVDAGRYSCLAFNEAGSAELMYHVRVSEPPQRNEAVTRNLTIVTLRPLRRFMLLCAMSGSPPPNMTWFKDDSLLNSGGLNGTIQISSDGRQLHILKALQEHEGLYKCHAENIVGSVDAFFQALMDAEGDWGDWSDWSMCSVSCDFGSQERKRQCLAAHCPGDSLETRPCFMSYCPVNGGWSNWTEWTGCEQSCGSSEKNRSRECNNPEPAYGGRFCEGENLEKVDCNLLPCPVDGGWSPWSEWHKCSVSCGDGVQIRHRDCNNPVPAHGGQTCVGYDSDVTSCNVRPCLGAWSEWSDWTPCSATCGPGRRQRRRKCSSEWSNCIGDNKQFEYCKLRRCIGDGPKKAHLRLHGSLNGYNIRNDTLNADISGDEEIKRGFISTRLHNIHKREVPIQPIVPLLVSPVSWNAAYEDRDARNGYSLTKGYFNQDSRVQFATGHEMKMRHVGQGVDPAGQLQVDIEVIGELPYIQPRATILVQPFSESFIQTGPNTLYVESEGALSADGQVIPYLWNSTVSYKVEEGAMPYLTEKMSTDHIITNYDHDLQEMRYTVSTVISQSFEDNKCPEGFKLSMEHQHCEDVNECMDSASNKCHSTQLCENLLGSYRCTCSIGFKALNIGTRCLDVNECLQEPSLCSHDCRNVQGSYLCLCPPGTYLLEDRHSCSASTYWDDPDETYGAPHLIGEATPDQELEKGQDSPEDNSDFDLQEFRSATEEWSCAEGLILKDGECHDRDECLDDPDICGEEETCLNMHESFKCLYTPCGEGFIRDPISRECIAFCSRDSPCSSGATQAEKKVFMAVPLDPGSNEPGMDLVHLSVSHDVNPGKLFSLTKYYFGNNHKGKMFHLRQEVGQCVLYISKKLKPGKVYRIEVRGNTFSDNSKKTLFSTKFTIFLHVLNKNSQ